METGKDPFLIMLIDMNSFFASVEEAINPRLKSIPFAIGGGKSKKSVVAAANYQAKKYGVKNGMSYVEAKKLCPTLKMIEGDMDKYIYTSDKLYKIFLYFTPFVERYSIDEVFLHLESSVQEAVKLAKKIKERIKKSLNLTCSIGIGDNKSLAKMATKLQKLDGLVVLRKKDFPEKLKDLSTEEMWGIGARTAQKLKEKLSVKTIGQLNKCTMEKLVAYFGTFAGERIFKLAQGEESESFSSLHKETDVKSIGHSYTLPHLIIKEEIVEAYLLFLSEQVGRRLRKEGYCGNILRVALGGNDFDYFSIQRKTRYLRDGISIFKGAKRLWKKKWDNLKRKGGVRFVGVSVSNLLKGNQLSLWSEEKNENLQKAIDKINDSFGEFFIKRSSLVDLDIVEKIGMIHVR